MGVLVSKLLGVIMGNKEVRVLILGLDNAGKTTILKKFNGTSCLLKVPVLRFTPSRSVTQARTFRPSSPLSGLTSKH